jgi:hypothetical protein
MSHTESKASPHWAPAATLLLAFTAVFGLYWPSLTAQLVWDDHLLIEDDVQIRSIQGLSRALLMPFVADPEHPRGYGYWRPVVTLTYAAQRWAHGDNPIGYHLVNLMLHGINTALVSTLARLRGASILAQAAACVVFLALPAHIESVTWVAGRTDLLATGALLAALVFHHRRAPLGVAICFALALFSKELALVGPLLAVLLSPRRHLLQMRWPWALPLVLWAGGRLLTGGGLGSPGVPASLFEWLQSAPGALWHYLGHVGGWTSVLPYHQLPLLDWATNPAWWAGCAAVLTAVALGLAQPNLGLGLAAAGLLLVPSLNLVRITAPMDMGFPVADRFMYAPWAAACATLAAAIDTGVRRATRPRSQAALALVLAGTWTAVQLPPHRAAQLMWSSDVRLFSAAWQAHPDAPLLRHWLVESLRRAGRTREALFHARRFAEEHVARGEAVPTALQSSLTALSGDALTPRELVRVLERGIQSRAREEIESNEWFNLGWARHRAGDAAGAEAAWTEALRSDPHHPGALSGLCVLAIDAGDLAQAEARIQALQAVDPAHASVPALRSLTDTLRTPEPR